MREPRDIRHCEEQSDEAIQGRAARSGLLRSQMTGRINAVSSDRIIKQIAPSRVHRFDQRELFLSRPAFDLLLASDRIRHGRMYLVPDEQLAAISRREARDQALAVLVSAFG